MARARHSTSHTLALKPVLVYGTLILILLTQIACGRKEAGRREITFAAALLPSERIEYVKVLDDFTTRTGIAVKLITQQYAQIRTTIEAEAQAGRGELDVAELDVYQLPILLRYMQPLDSLLDNLDELRASISKSAWQVAVFGPERRVFYVPHRLNWQALICDSEALAEPLSTWEALLKFARSHPGRVGLKLAKYEGLVCDFFPFLWQAGGDPLHANSDAGLQTMLFLKKLQPYLNKSARSYKENSVLEAQEHQEILLHINWPFAVALLRAKDLLPQRIKTAPLPRGPVTQATILGGGYLGIPITAPHPKQAAQLLRFLTSVQTQKQMVAELGWFPVRPEAWEAMTAQDREAFSGFLAMRDAVHARPNVPYYPEVSKIWQDGIYQILFEQKDPTTTLKEMQKKLDALANDT